MAATAQKKILRYGQPVAFPGMVTLKLDGDSAINKQAVGSVSSASGNIGFGLGVKAGTNLKEALLPSAGTDGLIGVVVQNQAYAPGTFGDVDQAGSPPGLITGTAMELLTEGRIWVVVDADSVITPRVTRGWWRFASDGASNTLVGTFRHANDAGANLIDVTNKVLFVSAMMDAADIVAGASPNTKIAEIVLSRSNK